MPVILGLICCAEIFILAGDFHEEDLKDWNPRDRALWKLYRPIYYFLMRRKISPGWPLLFLLAFPVFYPIVLKKRRGIELDWTDYAWTWVFIVAFVITIISQIAVCRGMFQEETVKKQKEVGSTETPVKYLDSPDRGAYYFREKSSN